MAHRDLELPPLTQTLDELRAELVEPDVVALKVREGGRLVGSVRLRQVGKAVELGRLVVAPDRRGRGVGSVLLRRPETVFPESVQVRLFTGEHSENDLRLYERHGYVESMRTPAGGYSLDHLVKSTR